MCVAVGQIVCVFRVFVRRAARLLPQLDVRVRVDDVHNLCVQGVEGRRLVEVISRVDKRLESTVKTWSVGA